jgi:hypothetical protein
MTLAACLVLMVSLIVVGGKNSKRDAEEDSHD